MKATVGATARSRAVSSLLKSYGIPITDEIAKAMRDLNDHPDEMELAGSKKKQRTEDGEVTTSDDLDTDQIDEFIRQKWASDLRMQNMSFDQFMRVTCPLCAFGNMAGDAIYAPKLQMIRTVVKHGAYHGSIKTTCFLACNFWNRYIMKPMVRRGRKIMRLTYDMCWEHLSEPHVPDPSLDARFDLADLTKLKKVAMNQIYRRNARTHELHSDEKMFNAAIRAINTKQTVRKNKLETQIFYDNAGDYGEEYAGMVLNPDTQTHFRAKEPPKNGIKKLQGARSATRRDNNANGGRLRLLPFDGVFGVGLVFRCLTQRRKGAKTLT